MTLLEKLNLEPGEVPATKCRMSIISEVTKHNDGGVQFFELASHMQTNFPTTLTNAEFLAACEEWLKKN